MEVLRIFRSEAHIYSGHYGRPAGTAPMIEMARAQVEAGCGLVGDRYHRSAGGHKGQVTFFSEEAWQRLREIFPRTDRGPEVFRRNLIVRGADLSALIGQVFTVQGLRFEGAEYCKPCFWMNQAFAPGTLKALLDWKAGGLRAKALDTGWLTAGDPKKREAGFA